MDRWATFDCYGTLIDWFGGVRRTLAALWPSADTDALLSRYHELEPGLHRHVHVAASLLHDVEPAAALGLPCVWINRRNETSALPRAGELPDFEGLVDALDLLVPSSAVPVDGG